jgi:hypothetical protein
MPHQENKAPQPKHGTLQKAPPLTPKDNDRLETLWTTQKTKLKQEPKGGPRVKERKVSIMLKDREKIRKEKNK